MLAGTEPDVSVETAARTYEPALDGLRAVCLFGVLLFHAGFGWASGGFLGVSTFFTLSGFLVTGLLLGDVDARGRVDLAGFWRRRLRRLAPASLWVLAAIAVVAPAWLDTAQRARLGADLLAALAQVSNWRFLEGDYAYSLLFTQPSLVQHFWSLSIEAQFYLVFPLVVGSVARGRAPRGGLAALAVLWIVGAAAASFVLGARPDAWDRIYYGSGLRLPELLTGCLLALALRRRAARAASPATWRRVGLLALGAALLAWVVADLETEWLYRGGFVAYALVSAAVVGACVAGSGGVRHGLAWAPLVRIGRVSYGAYLIHWPIYVALDASWPDLAPLPRFAICTPITFGLAALSHAWVEEPVRRERTTFGRRIVAATLAAMLGVACLVMLRVSPASIAAELRGPAAFADDQVGRPDERPKLAFFGDSTALSLAFGFAVWSRGDDAGARVLSGVSQLGCGVLGPAWVEELQRDGSDAEAWISQRGPFGGVPRKCLRFTDESAAYVREHGVDIAVVLFGEWDVAGVREPGGSRYRTLGEPEVDAVMKRAITALAHALRDAGAGTVVWLTSPPLARPARLPHAAPSWERTRLRYNELVREAAEERPGELVVVDLDAFVERLEAQPGAEPLRHDGVHFTLGGAERLARHGLGAALVDAAAPPTSEPGARAH